MASLGIQGVLTTRGLCVGSPWCQGSVRHCVVFHWSPLGEPWGLVQRAHPASWHLFLSGSVGRATLRPLCFVRQAALGACLCFRGQAADRPSWLRSWLDLNTWT